MEPVVKFSPTTVFYCTPHSYIGCMLMLLIDPVFTFVAGIFTL